MYTEEQREEYIKCAKDFPYFCETYVKLVNEEGLVPFKLYKDQLRLSELCDEYKKVIGVHYRWGGFSTLTVIKQLWRCMFSLDRNCLFISTFDRFAMEHAKIAKRAINNFPEWMKPEVSDFTNHRITFPETNCTMIFHGILQTWNYPWIHDIIYDDAACGRGENKDHLEQTEKCMFQRASHITMISKAGLLKDVADKFYKRCNLAKNGEGDFKLFTCNYKDHPKYSPEWENTLRENLGEKAWMFEYELKIPELIN